MAFVVPRNATAGASVRACERSAVAAPVRRALTVRAAAQQNNDRRQVLGGLLAGIAILGSSQKAMAIDIEDERNKSRMKGYDLIYEAREIELPQNVRDGLSQARLDPNVTKSRVKESESRIDSKLATFVSKAYWTDAREELRLQLGTLRFDLGVLGEQLDKTKRKEVQGLKKSFFAAVRPPPSGPGHDLF
ncbi:hypothetical protein WJX73_003240 [Symbiochloris irregularis]|uniref:Uncharacterized protein n=1 Tax=Symbiochloris irregularis TaxID=706552 RepID=A0AAW1NXC2_9CHLO